MRRVLIIRFGALGDILLTLPGVAELARQGYEIHYLTKAAFAPLVSMNDLVSRVHTIPNHATFADLTKKCRELKVLGFDLVVDLHRNLRSRIVSFALTRPVRRIWKYRFKESFLFVFRRGIFNFLRLKPINRPAEALRVAKACRSNALDDGGRLIGRAAILPDITLTVRSSDARKYAEELSSFTGGYVCVAVESAWPQKEWPLERFAAVAQRVVELGLGIVWVGLRPLPHAAQIAGALDLTGRLSIPEVAAVLSRSRMLLSNDSGLMHLSEALGIPVAAIFGPTTAELGFAPRLPASRVIEADLWCRPCSKTGRACIRPILRRKCLMLVSVNQVWRVVSVMLQGVARVQD